MLTNKVFAKYFEAYQRFLRYDCLLLQNTIAGEKANGKKLLQ